jgi:NAD(P)H-dependent FMN reductase
VLIQIVTGTTREGRFSERVASWINGHLTGRSDFDIESVDLRDYPLPFFEGGSPARSGRDYPREDVRAFGDTAAR